MESAIKRDSMEQPSRPETSVTSSGTLNGAGWSFEFDRCHSVIHLLMAALQHHFKKDTLYTRPLMTPQGNVVYALDEQAALSMQSYMSDKLHEVTGLQREEYRFVRRTNGDGHGLQRIRLEFTHGVTVSLLHRIEMAASQLETPDNEAPAAPKRG